MPSCRSQRQTYRQSDARKFVPSNCGEGMTFAEMQTSCGQQRHNFQFNKIPSKECQKVGLEGRKVPCRVPQEEFNQRKAMPKRPKCLVSSDKPGNCTHPTSSGIVYRDKLGVMLKLKRRTTNAEGGDNLCCKTCRQKDSINPSCLGSVLTCSRGATTCLHAFFSRRHYLTRLSIFQLYPICSSAAFAQPTTAHVPAASVHMYWRYLLSPSSQSLSVGVCQKGSLPVSTGSWQPPYPYTRLPASLPIPSRWPAPSFPASSTSPASSRRPSSPAATLRLGPFWKQLPGRLKSQPRSTEAG
ncbi:unnamed protein product [Protopolystoma xenopodis]|uniref:Uncharacterized protein n=1 Tax=Protopolystoma xenopodis TaxID=117903 RepID=A0A448WJV1_9PLAT|nr:unnamed protein product [Protopolystoma xenopodis]